jgi:hypothetical protein
MFSQSIRLYVEVFHHSNRYQSTIISSCVICCVHCSASRHSWEVCQFVVTEQLAGVLSKIVCAHSEYGCCPEDIR